MKKKINELTIGEAKLRLKECSEELAELQELFGNKIVAVNSNGSHLGKYVIIRTFSAGVFAGNLKCQNGKEVELTDARRLWYWEGASSLSELAMKGVASPDKCKFPCEVKEITLTESIEIIPCTEKAQKSIKLVKEWKQND